MSAFDPTTLLAIGIALIAVEIFATSFYLFWMGIGFMLAAGISALYPFENGITQLAIALSTGTLLVVLLRKKTAELALRAKETPEEKSHTGGIAVIDKGHVKFDGTYWKCNDDLSGYRDGDRVKITIADNVATVVGSSKD